MTTKLIHRNIPSERENKNDRFRVKYNSKNEFTTLEVKIKRLADGVQQLFTFRSEQLPDSDSIYFTTSIENNKMLVRWSNIMNSGSSRNDNKKDQKYMDMNKESSKGKKAFLPIANDRSKILILGTMPGERSLALHQYYGHAGNQFWKIIYSLFDKPFGPDYENRKKLLLDNGIVLWDVLQYCEGIGSLDSNIINEKANDFKSFYNGYKGIKHVFFTSKKAATYYDSYVKRQSVLEYHLLPSPNKINTWKTFDEKSKECQLILTYL